MFGCCRQGNVKAKLQRMHVSEPPCTPATDSTPQLWMTRSSLLQRWHYYRARTHFSNGNSANRRGHGLADDDLDISPSCRRSDRARTAMYRDTSWGCRCPRVLGTLRVKPLTDSPPIFERLQSNRDQSRRINLALAP